VSMQAWHNATVLCGSSKCGAACGAVHNKGERGCPWAEGVALVQQQACTATGGWLGARIADGKVGLSRYHREGKAMVWLHSNLKIKLCGVAPGRGGRPHHAAETAGP
jgi:hypothetical protein